MKIKRRVLSCIICFILILGLIPTIPTQAADDDPVYSAVAEQYDAYVRSLGSVSSSDAANVLYRHALRGNGKYLSLAADSAFTKGMLKSDLTRMAFIDGISSAVRYILENNCSIIALAGASANYSYENSYFFHVYDSFDESVIKDRNNAAFLLYTQNDRYLPGFTPNSYDQMLSDVVGACLLRVFVERVSLSKDSLNVKLKLKMLDDFDFNGSQNSSASLGSWLDGKFIDSFSWESSVSMEMELPNTCTHYEESAVYRWEVDDGELVNVSGEGLNPNPLTSVQSLDTEGKLKGYCYKTEKTILLNNDRPWAVEFRIGGSGQFSIAPIFGTNYEPHFLWTHSYVCGMYGWVDEYAMSNGSTGVRRACGQLRYDYETRLWDTQHTYRIENRIAPDGSNMAWLLIDGEEMGPLDDYWHRYTGSDNKTHYDHVRDGDQWFDTADFALNCFFTSGAPMTDKCKLEYVQIWENGEEEPYKYYSDYTTDASCTESAKAVHSCHVCGAEYAEELSPALGHSFGEYIPDNNASCTADGTKTAVCTVCGEKDTQTVEGSALGHRYVPAVKEPTCTERGYTTHGCTVCGDSYTDGETPATGHSWDGGILTKAPTLESEGEMLYTCSLCGGTRTESIEKLIKNPFSDVSENDYFCEPVLWALKKGVTSGVSEHSFAPDNICTRAQVVTFLYRSAGEPDVAAEENPFADVPEDAYYRDAVLWALERGITAGLSEDSFGPDEPCSRAQVVTFLWRANGKAAAVAGSPFDDVAEDAYYCGAVLWAVEAGITAGVSAQSFGPDAPCTRAQTVTFLYRAQNNK